LQLQLCIESHRIEYHPTLQLGNLHGNVHAFVHQPRSYPQILAMTETAAKKAVQAIDCAILERGTSTFATLQLGNSQL
jgi:hypothetical protein